ncbi:hypothetical protein NMY22_g223 [Coprinellus aureogranulatus]|nr:hypothetical protein NMY22_g223 [Coprinellus aureogranulatus]
MGGPIWHTIEQLEWLESQLPRFIEAQREKGEQVVGKALSTLCAEFFGMWKDPEAEAKGTYKQPKRVRKDKPQVPRKVFTNKEKDEWVIERKKQVIGWFNNAAKREKTSVPKLEINMRSAVPRVPTETQIYTKLYGDKLKQDVSEKMEGRAQKERIAILNEVARESYKAESEEVKAAVEAEKVRLREERDQAVKIEEGLEQTKAANDYSNAERSAAIKALPEAMRQFTSHWGPRTGFTFMIVASGPQPDNPNAEIETMAYHYGQTRQGFSFGAMNAPAVDMILAEFNTFNHLVTPRIPRSPPKHAGDRGTREVLTERGSAPVIREPDVFPERDEDTGEFDSAVVTVLGAKKKGGKKKGKKKDKDSSKGDSGKQDNEDRQKGMEKDIEVTKPNSKVTAVSAPGGTRSPEPQTEPNIEPGNNNVPIVTQPQNPGTTLISEPIPGSSAMPQLVHSLFDHGPEGQKIDGGPSDVEAEQVVDPAQYWDTVKANVNPEDAEEDYDDRFGGFRLPAYEGTLDETQAGIDDLFQKMSATANGTMFTLPTYENPLFEHEPFDNMHSGGGKCIGSSSVKGRGGDREEGGGEADGKGDVESTPDASTGSSTSKGSKRKRGETEEEQVDESLDGGRRTRDRKKATLQMPQWFEEDMNYLGGEMEVRDWTDCLEAYAEFEKRAQQLGMKGRRLGATKLRPQELEKWLAGRRYHNIPSIEDLRGFAARWLDWWKEMQPVSRKYTFENDLPGPLKATYDVAGILGVAEKAH